MVGGSIVIPHLRRAVDFLDQLDPWRRGKYNEMPLRMKTVRETFAHRTILAP